MHYIVFSMYRNTGHIFYIQEVDSSTLRKNNKYLRLERKKEKHVTHTSSYTTLQGHIITEQVHIYVVNVVHIYLPFQCKLRAGPKEILLPSGHHFTEQTFI